MDGYGQSAVSIQACTAPSGYVSAGGDCNDDFSYIHPGAPEHCDNVDEDCDMKIDEDLVTYYADRDGDTYGNAAESTLYVCSATIPSGLVLVAGDCNDLDAQIHPLADDVADHIDNDCDGVIDCIVVWEPKFAKAGEPVMIVNFDGGWGGHRPFIVWTAVFDRFDLQRILCER
jgi:hypothetical protein